MPAPWERRSDESPKAFHAFATYRDLGPARSLDRARQALGKNAAGYKRLLDEWSSKYAWVERVAAWDAHHDALARERFTLEWQARRQQIAKDAERDQEASSLLVRALSDRFERDPASLGALDELSADALATLALAAARTRKHSVAVEMLARGVLRAETGNEEEDEAVTSLASALEAVAKERRAEKKA